MDKNRWERLAPLTGVISVAIIVAVFAIGGDTPEGEDGAAKVQAYYLKHHDKHATLAFILAIAVPFLLFFVSSLRNDLRRAGGSGQLANAAFAGGVLAAGGFAILATVHLALAESAAHVRTLDTTHALNVLDGNDFIPVAAGLGLLVFAAGASAIRNGGLPKWLGWIGIIVGIVAFTPAGFFAFIAGGVWIIIAGVLLTLARGSAAPAAPPPAPASP
jgi:hypothetical protein